MEGLPLARYELFHSTNLDEARQLIGQVFVPHRLELVGTSALDARMHTRRIARIAANFVSYGGEVLIEPGRLGSFFVVQVPLSGFSTIRAGGQEIYTRPGLASVISPTEELTMRWSAGCSKLILRLERSAVEAHLRDLLGTPLHRPVRFELGMNLESGFGRSWAVGLRTLVQEMDRVDGSLINNRLAAAEFEDAMITALLVAQPHNYSSMLDESALPPVPSRAVTIVRELIENHPEWRHTVATLAREANVGVRALEKAFAAHLGTTPKRYLTEVRLSRARDELRAAQRDVTTVSRVAAAWGFNHPGRFAKTYLDRFGELPSQTLVP